MRKAKPRNKQMRGRPSRFNEDLVEHAKTLSSIGLSYSEIAKDLEVPEKTFFKWLSEKPNFRETIDKNKNKMLKDAKRCLAIRIEGYEYEEEKEFYERNGDTMMLTKKQKIKKVVPPDTAAAIQVLERRSPHFKKDNEDLSAKELNINVTIGEN